MIRIVDFSLKHRGWVLAIFVLIFIGGFVALKNLPIDAVPDITNVQVIVNARTGGLDPQQVEKSVTFFIEAEMAGIPNVQEVRSLSRFGLSQTIIIFEDGTNIYWARQQVAERIQSATEKIPQGVSVEMAPITTGLGEVFMYVLQLKEDSPHAKEGYNERLVYLRTVQDFILKPYLKAHVKGAAEVDSLGGYEKQIDLDVDPEALERYGVTLNNIVQKFKSLGENYGGGYIEEKKQQIIVRTEGGYSLNHLGEMPIKMSYDGKPIRLKKIAQVRTYHPQRLGAATYRGEETVLGTVLMLMGQNSRDVAKSAANALKSAPLPNDIETQVVYSRSFLVDATIKTVIKNLIEGAALVIIIILLFLNNTRAAFFVMLSIPFAMVFTLIGMKNLGVSANLMSLGALDFGLIVDGSIVMIENVITLMEKHKPKTNAEKLQLVKNSAREVIGPLATGLIIIMGVYLPILTLEGVEGKLYYPMAITVLFALLGALVMALFVIPTLACFVNVKPSKNKSAVMEKLYRAYEPLLNFSIRHTRKTLVSTVAFLAFCIFAFSRLGSDFMPPLNEGDITFNFLHDAKISLSETLHREKAAEKKLLTYPEVDTVFSRIGTSEAATDPMGVNLTDLFVILKKDQSQWRKNARGKTISYAELIEKMRNDLQPLLKEEWNLAESELVETQPIAMRFNEMLEGSRADISLRIYGKDLDTLIDLQTRIIAILKQIRGASEIELDALTALRKSRILDARLKRDRLNFYGIALQDANEALEMAMVGRNVGSYYEEDWRFRVDVIIADEKRKDLNLIKKIPLALPEGGNIRFGDIAEFKYSENVTSIARSSLTRYAGIAIYLKDRDTLSFVDEAKTRIAQEIQLPPMVHLGWGGQFRNLERAQKKLIVIVPLALLAIAFLIYRTFRSINQTFLIFLTIPFAWTGGILALWISGLSFSVSAAVGFIALSGVAVLNGLVEVSYINQLIADGHPVADAVHLGARGRLRPVLMTALVAGLGFLPMVLNTGIGAEVQRPLAVVVLGGLITATLMTIFLLPALYNLLERKKSV
ncbi:MAG TPA: CusA/CzcA family heavy metal efflux RND transporter [Turneriella sp.]|nr:CusA/CzcA family heavy metal efflux RND transporter [Turneriella sp.]